jgi:(E)-4-hydroxy-3-methylbut-2-enyl-diphosphate synthase
MAELERAASSDEEINFLKLDSAEINEEVMSILEVSNLVVLLSTQNKHAMPALRRFFFALERRNIEVPVIIVRNYTISDEEEFLIHASTDMGGLLIEGYGDGVMLEVESQENKEDFLADLKIKNETGFGILQAARTRMTKTEYISCPSCGRTLFDLQETTAKIRKRTDHLKGVKIGIDSLSTAGAQRNFSV